VKCFLGAFKYGSWSRSTIAMFGKSFGRYKKKIQNEDNLIWPKSPIIPQNHIQLLYITESWKSYISLERLKIFVCKFCRLLIFLNIYISLTLFGRISTIWVSNCLELDQTPSYSASDLAPSCLQRLLQLRFFTLQSSKGYRCSSHLIVSLQIVQSWISKYWYT